MNEPQLSFAEHIKETLEEIFERPVDVILLDVGSHENVYR
jgi:hypothetical protein